MAVNDPLYAARVRSILQSRGFFNVPPVEVVVRHVADGTVSIAAWDPKYGAQPTDAQVSAITDVAATAAVANEAQRSAQSIIDKMPIFEKAIILALIDQLNVIRGKLSPPLGNITPAAAIQAVRDKAGTL